MSTAAQFETIYQELLGREVSSADEAQWVNSFERCVPLCANVRISFTTKWLMGRAIDAEMKKLYELRGDCRVVFTLEHEKLRRSVGAIFQRMNEAKIQLEVSRSWNMCTTFSTPFLIP